MFATPVLFHYLANPFDLFCLDRGTQCGASEALISKVRSFDGVGCFKGGTQGRNGANSIGAILLKCRERLAESAERFLAPKGIECLEHSHAVLAAFQCGF